jgi:hypothetical protein
LSLDFFQDARESLGEDGYPFVILQLTRTAVRHAWNTSQPPGTNVTDKQLANALRVLASQLDGKKP